jgi:hypothetical protein
MNRDAGLQFHFGDAAKSLLQDRRLDLKLMLVSGVLIMAAATAAEIRTARFYPMRRSLKNHFRAASRKTPLLLEQRSIDSFAFKHKGNEYSFAGAMLIGGQAGEAVASINEFFNRELQARILCWKQYKELSILDFKLAIENLKCALPAVLHM